MQVVSYGMGTNSTAMIIRMIQKNEPIDAITCADTGGEWPETYQYLQLFNDWVLSQGLPAIEVVKKGGRVETLEENCLRMKMLPSIAYGFKSCSLKYKAEPQDKFFNNHPPARAEWAAGRKIIKCIGYDAGEPHRAKPREDEKYIVRYPLVEWGIDREGCIDIIRSAGLPLPGKSSCFFCPSNKTSEILTLGREHPDLLERALAIEANAELTQVKGLGRRFSWAEFIAADRAQLKMDFSYEIEAPCDCYDGGSVATA